MSDLVRAVLQGRGLHAIFRCQAGNICIPKRCALDRQQKIDWQSLRLDLTQLQKHIHDVFFAFTHTDDTAAADLKSQPLKHADVCHTLLKCMGCADVVIVRTAAVQIVIDAVKTGIFEYFRLFFRQKSDGTAKVCSLFFHFADAAGKLFNLASVNFMPLRPMQCLDK